MHTILITGGTGAVGTEVVSQLTSTFPEANLILATRHHQKSEHFFFDLHRPEAFDHHDPRLQEVTHVLHMAADVRWNLPDEKALAVNTKATELLCDHLKTLPRLKHFLFMSTAFVDEVSHPKDEETCYHRTSYNNSYEYSKHLAERIVTESGLPFTILRPSIVVGRKQDGVISHFNGVYQILEAYMRGFVPIVPGFKDSRLDIVPVDLVAQSVIWSIAHPEKSLMRVVPCSSGSSAISLEKLMHIAETMVNNARVAHLQAPLKAIEVMDPHRFDRLIGMAKGSMPQEWVRGLNILKHFLPYLRIKTTRQYESGDIAFVCRETEDLLKTCIGYWLSRHYTAKPSMVVG